MRIDPAGWPFVLVLALATAAAAWLLPLPAAIPPAALLAFTLWFFRDPERVAPDEPGALISPVDGRVIVAGPTRVSIFMNVFDVHVCRAPAAGRVRSVRHHDGRFLAAWRDDAPELNERAVIDLDRDAGAVRFTLVAGLVARRIVVRVAEGATLAPGQRLGLIRFGSRVDVDLPADARAAVRVGERVRGGESVIARPGHS